ncbi:MAG: hypothetical protein JRG86_00185 [Deltaproteobacteria bacterium]|jgi:hypothetical protein|nr:hypothetical protein [Deltaproteobacteria bacterium]
MMSSSTHRKFRSQRRRALLLVLVLVLLASPAQAENAAARAALSTVDVLVLRPVGLGATVAGTLFYTVMLPLSLLTGGEPQAREVWVLQPFAETFERPLGEW